MTIRAAVRRAIESLEAGKIPGARLDAELLMAYVIGHDRAWLLAHDDTELDEPELEQFHALITRRQNREPVVHLTGTREFYGHDFAITPDVLTPRVETEQMVEWATKYAPQNSRLIDIGTGSGAIAIAIKLARPDLTVLATEVSEVALEVAHANALSLEADVTFVTSDLWQAVDGRFDTVCTNLPYLKDEAREELMDEVKREPDVALFGGADGLELYRRFLKGIRKHLEPDGFLFTECDPWQQPDLIKEAARHGLNVIEQGYFIAGFQDRS